MSGRSFDLMPVPNAPNVPPLYRRRGKPSEETVPHVLVPSGEDENKPKLNGNSTITADFAQIPGSFFLTCFFFFFGLFFQKFV